MERLTMSMCVSRDYMQGWNDCARKAESHIAELKSLLRRARPHVDAPLGTLAADIDLALNR